jgi:hypothetical protein
LTSLHAETQIPAAKVTRANRASCTRQPTSFFWLSQRDASRGVREGIAVEAIREASMTHAIDIVGPDIRLFDVFIRTLIFSPPIESKSRNTFTKSSILLN